ncbi:MAG: hypothetical protein ACHQFX_06490 [Chitinophagales bacterium]
MKKISIRLFAIALIATVMTVFASPALANDEKKSIPVELKFAGISKNQPLFHLVFNSTEENEYTIIVRDDLGNIFYKEIVKGTVFLKKFRLNTEEIDDANLKFEIRSKAYDKPVVFEINNQSRYVDEVIVKKIK